MSGTGARENADGFKVSVTKLSESPLSLQARVASRLYSSSRKIYEC